MGVTSWMPDKVDLVQIYIPVYSASSIEPVAILSALLKIKPVRDDIFAIQDKIPQQTILMRTGGTGSEQLLSAGEWV